MEFHGIPWHLRCANFTDMSSSMEFRGIPWNLKCANFAYTSSSMEFYTILKLSALMIPMVPLNNKKGSIEFHGTATSSSMEFHGTCSALISLTRAVPWNSMELGIRQFQ